MNDYTLKTPGIYRVYRGPIGNERKGRFADFDAASPFDAEEKARPWFLSNWRMGMIAKGRTLDALDAYPGEAERLESWFLEGIEIGAEQGQRSTEELRAPVFEKVSDVEARKQRARERAIATRARRNASV